MCFFFFLKYPNCLTYLKLTKHSIFFLKKIYRQDGTFSIVLKLPIGTHRMRFVVDNELRCSDYLPSATDSMGNLVNYIEVPFESDVYSMPNIAPVVTTSSISDSPSGAVAGSGGVNVAYSDDAYSNYHPQDDDSMEPLHRVNSNHYAPDDRRESDSSSRQYQQQYNNQYQQPYGNDQAQQKKLQRATTAEKVANYDMSNDDELLNGGGYERFQEELPADPVYKFTSEIPRVFTDPEVMEQFVSSDFVTPPQLPPHLENVILNSNSNEKDNNSVLPIPNHVVLNHLATTSIKHNVLAVASISRYSRKYVTQILYAPL